MFIDGTCLCPWHWVLEEHDCKGVNTIKKYHIHIVKIKHLTVNSLLLYGPVSVTQAYSNSLNLENINPAMPCNIKCQSTVCVMKQKHPILLACYNESCKTECVQLNNESYTTPATKHTLFVKGLTILFLCHFLNKKVPNFY